MLRGYVHHVKYPLVADQRKALATAGVDADAIYTDLDLAIRHLRKGDRLVLGGGLHILADDRDKIELVVERIQKKGCEVLDVTTGDDTTGRGVAMMGRAWRYVWNKNRFGSPRAAAKKSVKARFGELHKSREDTKLEAMNIFWDTSLSIKECDDALREKGWNIQAARRYLTRKGKLPKRQPGRPAG